MAITVNEVGKRKASIDRRWIRTYERQYQIVSDGAALDGPEVLLALNFSIGALYPGDLYAAALSITAEADNEDHKSWTATVPYGPFDPRITENPLDAPAEVEWDEAQFEEICDEDINGDPIVNSAGDSFDPPITRDQTRPVLRVQVNMPDFNSSLASGLRDAINGAAWYGWDVHTVKVSSIKGRRAYHPFLVPVNGTGFYWIHNYEFHFNPRTFDRMILDQGLRYLDGSALRNVLIDGAPATAPVLLDGKGKQLATGGTPAYLIYQVYDEIDFSLAFPFIS